MKKTLFILSIIIFTLILYLVLTSNTLFIDNSIYNAIKYLIKPVGGSIIYITNLASAITLICICIISLIVIKNKKIGLTMSLNLVLVTLINQFIKLLVGRSRPTGINLIIEKGYSFPSGHSMASLAFYGFIIYLIYKYIKSKKIKNISIFFLSLLILLIGISRIYLGVHYATDVIGGYMLSLAYLTIYIDVLNKKGII